MERSRDTIGFLSRTGSHVPCYTTAVHKAFWDLSSATLFVGPSGGLDDKHYPSVSKSNGAPYTVQEG